MPRYKNLWLDLFVVKFHKYLSRSPSFKGDENHVSVEEITFYLN